jgi:hypothetical protein
MIPLPPNTTDETGHVYGALTVLEYSGAEEGSGHALWACRCDCGQPACRGAALVRGSKLRAGRVVSCGALRSSSAVRQAARMTIPARERRRIATLAGRASAKRRRKG